MSLKVKDNELALKENEISKLKRRKKAKIYKGNLRLASCTDDDFFTKKCFIYMNPLVFASGYNPLQIGTVLRATVNARGLFLE